MYFPEDAFCFSDICLPALKRELMFSPESCSSELQRIPRTWRVGGSFLGTPDSLVRGNRTPPREPFAHGWFSETYLKRSRARKGHVCQLRPVGQWGQAYPSGLATDSRTPDVHGLPVLEAGGPKILGSSGPSSGEGPLTGSRPAAVSQCSPRGRGERKFLCLSLFFF